MTIGREAKETVKVVDEYCEQYRELFSDVRTLCLQFFGRGMVTWRRLRYKRSNQANLTRGEHHVAADDMPGCATTPIFGSVRVLFQCSPVPALCHRAVGADAERGTQHVAGTGAASNGGGQ